MKKLSIIFISLLVVIGVGRSVISAEPDSSESDAVDKEIVVLFEVKYF